MSQIKSKDTKPEILVRKLLFSKGFRYRVHDKSLIGRPDVVLPKYKTAIFVHGCFWHGHKGCKFFKIPKTRTDWWKEKIFKNKERDTAVEAKLSQLGWRVIIVWECELKNDLNEFIKDLSQLIRDET